ncbi:MAG: hypothetical protein JEZ06_11255 [Anaerolineaceae bacterium]|nr:hypothetical protein [Anaerolineaceae bacterium]
MKFNTRELTTLAVFGVLWGIVEISLGSVLKSLNIPLSGVVLSTLGLILMMIGRVFVPKKGSSLFIGVLACILKLFSLGGVIIGPMIGIITEAVIVELLLSLSANPTRAKFVFAGAIGVFWCMIQPFVTGPLLFGRSMLMVWLDLIDLGSRLLRLNNNVVWLIIMIMALIHFAIGAVAGWFSWDVGVHLKNRMRRTELQSAN